MRKDNPYLQNLPLCEDCADVTCSIYQNALKWEEKKDLEDGIVNILKD